MLTHPDSLKALITDYSRQVVAQVAPEEGDMFDELSGGYFANPTPPPQNAKPADDDLGFGMAEALVAATPAATAMVSAVLTYVMGEVIKTSQEEAATVLKEKIKRLFAGFSKTPEPPGAKGKEAGAPPKKEKEAVAPLTKEQFEAVKAAAVREGRAFGLGKAEAEKMALALIGVLATQ